jgi:hypothetical protein
LRAVTHNARWHGADPRTSASPTPPLPHHHWPFSVGSPANQRCSGALGRGCTHPCSPRMCPSLCLLHTHAMQGSMSSAGPRSTIQRTLMRSQHSALLYVALRCWLCIHGSADPHHKEVVDTGMYVCTGGLSAWLPSRACACACHSTEHPFDPTPRTCTAGTCASNPRKLSGCPTIEELRVCDPNVQFRWSVGRALVTSRRFCACPPPPPPPPLPLQCRHRRTALSSTE